MFFPHHLRLATTASTAALMALLATTVSGAAVRASHGAAGYNRYRCSTVAMMALIHEILKYHISLDSRGCRRSDGTYTQCSMLLRGYEDEQQSSEFAVGDKKSHGGTGNDVSTLHQHRTLQEPRAKIELVNGNSSSSRNRRFFLNNNFQKYPSGITIRILCPSHFPVELMVLTGPFSQVIQDAIGLAPSSSEEFYKKNWLLRVYRGNYYPVM